MILRIIERLMFLRMTFADFVLYKVRLLFTALPGSLAGRVHMWVPEAVSFLVIGTRCMDYKCK